MKYLLIFLLLLIVFIVSVTLGAQNNQLVTFNYIVAQGEYRMSSLFAVLFATGFIMGWLVCVFFWLKVWILLVHAKRKIKSLENQIASINNIK